MHKNLLIILHTVRHLKVSQIYYQIWYRLKKAKPLSGYNRQFEFEKIVPLSFALQPPVYNSVIDENENHFAFLNLDKRFGTDINWNEQYFGKLWNYNLQYCNYLLQGGVSYGRKKYWLLDLYNWLCDGRLILEPYPVTIRSINVIRMMSQYGIEAKFLPFLHAELDFLNNRLEFHLLGNHLLENLFGLLMGGAFFNEKKWTERAKFLIISQLNEQILPDGAHFELSPMYHKLMLFRLLELIDWYQDWEGRNDDFIRFLKDKAERMLSWLKQISFHNGDVPQFNDGAEGIAYSTNWLLSYSKVLGLNFSEKSLLRQSGYRSVKWSDYECKIDFAEIGASYQPGHGHADAFSFVLYLDNKPFLIDPGVSTYNPCPQRLLERSTSLHNTVTIDDDDQSEIYGAFRVGNRAHIYDFQEFFATDKIEFKAWHDGYLEKGVRHFRGFTFFPNQIIIKDTVEGKCEVKSVANYLFDYHFFDKVSLVDNFVYVDNVKIEFKGDVKIRLIKFECPHGYNLYKNSIRLEVVFSEILITHININ